MRYYVGIKIQERPLSSTGFLGEEVNSLEELKAVIKSTAFIRKRMDLSTGEIQWRSTLLQHLLLMLLKKVETANAKKMDMWTYLVSYPCFRNVHIKMWTYSIVMMVGLTIMEGSFAGLLPEEKIINRYMEN